MSTFITPQEIYKKGNVGPALVKFYRKDGALLRCAAVTKVRTGIVQICTPKHPCDVEVIEIVLCKTLENAQQLKLESALSDGWINQCRELIKFKQPQPTTRQHLASAPHFVYKHLSASGQVLYIGCTSNMKQRQRQHTEKPWFHQISTIESAEFPDKRSGLDEERRLIRLLRPKHNSCLLSKNLQAAA